MFNEVLKGDKNEDVCPKPGLPETEQAEIVPLIGEKIYQPDEDGIDFAQSEAENIESPEDRFKPKQKQVEEARSKALELIQEQEDEEQARQAKAQEEASMIERGDLSMSRSAESSDEDFITSDSDILGRYRDLISEVKRQRFLALLRLETLETNSDDYRETQRQIEWMDLECLKLERDERTVRAFESMSEKECLNRVFDLAEKITSIINMPEVHAGALARIAGWNFKDEAFKEKEKVEENISEFHSFRPVNPDKGPAIIVMWGTDGYSYIESPKYEFGFFSDEQGEDLYNFENFGFGKFIAQPTPQEVNHVVWAEVSDRLDKNDHDLLLAMYLEAAYSCGEL